METFKLYEDEKQIIWKRYFYEIEAESLEEARNQIIESSVDYYDSEELLLSSNILPKDNEGCATREICDNNDEMIWNNAEK